MSHFFVDTKAKAVLRNQKFLGKFHCMHLWIIIVYEAVAAVVASNAGNEGYLRDIQTQYL